MMVYLLLWFILISDFYNIFIQYLPVRTKGEQNLIF
jgi:hypothetical protein